MSIYLNNAATTWPKPHEVSEAINEFLSKQGANLARGTSSERDLETLNFVLDCRIKLADFFNGYENCDPRYVTFCSNITEALNIVLRGFLKPGMRVITSSMEHNAVMRPLRFLEKNGVYLKLVSSLNNGLFNLKEFKNILEHEKFDLMIFAHASNVCGTVQPLNEIAELCKKFNLPLVLDSAQTAGVLKINVSDLNLSALCFTGHKSLMGPQGTGGIIWNPDFSQKVEPLITGGTGSFSHLEYQPEDLPDKFEAGTPNLPGISGLNAALNWLNKTGTNNIYQKEFFSGSYFLEKLRKFNGVKISGLTEMNNFRLPVFSFNFDGIDNGVLADYLSREGFETRPGLHCAPSAHRSLGTFPEGSLRVSPGFFNTLSEIDEFFGALEDALKILK